MRKIIFTFATVLMALMTATSTQAANQAYAVYTQSSKTLTFKYGTKPSGAYSLNEESETPGWIEAGKEIVKVVFDASFANARPTNTCEWFNECQKLEEIIGIENLNTSEVKNMCFMFGECIALKSLDLSSFDTRNVENMVYMFYNTGLTQLDLTSFNTSNVTDMSSMFADCSNLQTILVGKGWNLDNVTESVDMFAGCKSLEGCEGTQWDASYTDKTYARGDCGDDEPGYLWLMEAYAYLSQGGEEFHVTEEELEMLPQNSLVFRYDPHKKGMVNDGITVFDVLDADEPSWSGYAQKNEIQCVAFDYYFSNYRPTTTRCWFIDFTSVSEIIGIENLNTSEVRDMSSMFESCNHLTNLELSRFDTRNVQNMRFMFFNTSIKALDLSSFNTSNVTNMESMFCNCSSLETIDLSSFNTSNVTNMDNMFLWCSALKSIYVGSDWNTDEVTSSNNMFLYSSSLVGGMGTVYAESNPTDKTYARIDGGTAAPGYLSDAIAYVVFDENEFVFYYDCKKEIRNLDNEDIVIFDIQADEEYGRPSWYDFERKQFVEVLIFDSSFAKYRPTTTRSWFEDFTGLVEISGIENLNTSEVTDMVSMFWNCQRLKTLDLSSFNTSKVESMHSMFNSCYQLASLDLSNFDTRNVESMSYMFYGLYTLEELDLSSFNTSKVTKMYCMFSGNGELTTICVGGGWNTKNVTSSDSEYMFQGCRSLVGGMDTAWAEDNPTDKTYAHIDGGEENPGYFKGPASGIVTSIEAVADPDKESSAPLYNLQGQRVSQPVKGQIYIQGGKKIKM